MKGWKFNVVSSASAEGTNVLGRYGRILFILGGHDQDLHEYGWPLISKERTCLI